MSQIVYVSDTSSELQDVRPVVIEQIRKWNLTPVWLEENEKQAANLAETVRAKLASADCFISIVTFKRGWEPPGMDGKSLVEMEYETAAQLNKPRAIFLPRPGSPMGVYLLARTVGDGLGDRKAQNDFWVRIGRDGEPIYFNDEADLSKQIGSILMRWSGSSRTATVEAQAIAPSRDLAPGTASSLDIDGLADKVAEKTVARLQMIQQNNVEDLAQQAVKYNEALRLRPGELVFGRPLERHQFNNDIFMIMPFATEFTPIYQDVIRPAVAELKLTIRRGDEFSTSTGSIIEEVWAALNACRFVIADLTGGNDNVFYELGIAHTLNKPAILLTQAQKPEGVPFDVRHLRYVAYDNSIAGSARLRDDLKTAINGLLADLQEGWGISSPQS